MRLPGDTHSDISHCALVLPSFALSIERITQGVALWSGLLREPQVCQARVLCPCRIVLHRGTSPHCVHSPVRGHGGCSPLGDIYKAAPIILEEAFCGRTRSVLSGQRDGTYLAFVSVSLCW